MNNELLPDNVAKHVSQVSRVLPAYVVEDHQRFTQFLKHYYEWNSTQGSAAALNYMKINNDVDYVIDEMLDSYSNLFARNLPKDIKGDYRFFLKFLKNFYEIKGSEESYRILYNALFGEDVDIYFPKRSLFAPSSAVWAKDRQFRIRFNGNAYDLRGRTLKGENHGYTCIVSNVIKKDDVWIVLPQNETGAFEPDEKLDVSGLDEYAYIQPVYEIESFVSSNSWYDNDIIKLANDIVVKVDKIYYGNITSVTITEAGQGYSIGDIITTNTIKFGTGFSAKVKTIGANGEVLTIQQLRSGFGYVSDIGVTFVGGTGTGLVLTPTWNDEFKKIQSASLVTTKNKTRNIEETFSADNGDTFTLKKGVYVQPRYWKLIKGAPSSQTGRIQDSFYYQEFSYVLSSKANAKEYEQSLKNLLEIAGLKMFIELNVGDTEKISSQDYLSLEIF